ncbi:methyltransferase domain-containing protein [Candidatus Parcubacteria bacterium]|nr:MAG: methyltransferase domain-containing protein [Candidatus Parcubacteria bacterium]
MTLSKIARHYSEWEDLGHLDPYWAVLTKSGTRFQRWRMEDFLRTGEEEVKEVIQFARDLEFPKHFNRFLHFGCGVGRLTRAFSCHFAKSYGVDISAQMLLHARSLNRDITNCTFVRVPAVDGLAAFREECFDMIYTNIVLQHLPTAELIRHYIKEFVRTLRVGGLLVFQLPCYISFLHRLQPRRRLYSFLRSIGFSPSFVYERLRLDPLRMNFIPEHEVISLLAKLPAQVLCVKGTRNASSAVENRFYYITKVRV